MTVQLLEYINHYLGLSSDSKPTSGILKGSTFTETDTGLVYKFDGSSWFPAGDIITGIDFVSGKSGVDASTESLQVVDYEHHEIHSGSHYHIADVEDLSINNVFDMQFTTPNITKWSHLTFKLDTEAETLWYIYEGVVIVTPGTTITPLNNNRNSTNTSGNTIAGILNTSVANANSDTTVAGATIISHGIIGAGRSGGSASRENELILKQNTIYSLRAIASAAGYISFTVEWYEHTDKN